MQYYNNIISNKLIIILCCLHSLLLLKCYTCTCLRVCPNHARNTFTTFSEYVSTDMINFFGCVHLYVHHLLYELSIKVFPGKILRYETLAKIPAWQIHVSLIIVWRVWYHPAATNNHDDCYQATKVINCVRVLVHITVHCSYKANRADSSTTWYGTPHPKFMTEQGVYFRHKDLWLT